MPPKFCQLGDLIKFQRGFDLPAEKMIKGDVPVIGSNGIIGNHNKYTTKGPVITIGRSGNVGNPRITYSDAWCHNTTLFVKEFYGCDPEFIYYFLKTFDFKNYSGGSAVPTLNRNHIHNVEVTIPSSIVTQKKIAKILRIFDKKIETNEEINANLIQQLQTIYESYDKSNWLTKSADSVFDVGIGKTPPRKESKWFSTPVNKESIRWVSIADMGKSSMFIGETSETLTKDAVNTFNIRIVPNNTVILSFKLTIGRVAITDGQMCTNEAIAHFKTNDNRYVELLYVQLLSYNYDDLGNTSSIATAINSKTVKAMELLLPPENLLSTIHRELNPIAQQINSNLKEIRKLTELRDYLLPKLMSGEIDVSPLDLAD